MEESTKKTSDLQEIEKHENYSKSFRTKKRSYYFDVKANRYNEVYVTITESKRRPIRDGNYNNTRFTIFLYREDFENFMVNLEDVISYAKSKSESTVNDLSMNHVEGEEMKNDYSSIEFEDLGKR